MLASRWRSCAMAIPVDPGSLAADALLDHFSELPADLVLRKHFEYSGLDGAFLTHYRLRR
jgi:hypothetical protein